MNQITVEEYIESNKHKMVLESKNYIYIEDKGQIKAYLKINTLTIW